MLMRQALGIDEHAFGELLNLLDDNDRTDLCRDLIRDGDLIRARRVATAIRAFGTSRLALLAEIAVKQAQAGSSQAAQEAVALALDSSDQAEPDVRQIKSLALIACALALTGDQAAAETAFNNARSAAHRLASPSAALAAIAAAQVRAGSLEPAERTATQIGEDDYQGEALESLAVGQAEAGDVESAVRTLSGISTWSDHYLRGVRAVAAIIAATDPPLALHTVQDMLEPDQQDGALAAVAASAAHAGKAPFAAHIACLIESRRWRARALVDIVRESADCSAAGESVHAAIQAVTDDRLRPVLLAEFGLTRPPLECARFQALAIQQAQQATGEDRWEILTSIAAIQGKANLPDAPGIFAAARRAVLVNYDPWYSERELVAIARSQDEVGDSVGARETIAAALEGRPQQDETQWLVSLSLAGVASAQAHAGDIGSARQTIDMATAEAANLSGEMRAFTSRVIAEAIAETGDFDAAAKIVLSLLGPAEPEDEPEDDAEEDPESVRQAIAAGAAIAHTLTESGDSGRAAVLLAQLANRVAGQLASASLSYQDTIVGFAAARAEAGDFEGALDTSACDETSQAADAALAATAKVQTLAGDFAAATSTVRQIRQIRSRIPAVAFLAGALASSGRQGSASDMLAEAALEAEHSEQDPGRARYPVEESVWALVSIAKGQVATGLAEAGRHSLARAHELAAKIAEPAGQAQALSQIAQAQSALGDTGSALQTAHEIRHPWYSGEALFHVAAHAAGQDHSLTASMKVIDAIEDPWWHAVGLIAVAAPAHARGDEKAAKYFAEAQKLINQIAEGEHRTQLRKAIAEIFISSGCYTEAIETVRAMPTDVSSHLIQLADTLLTKNALEAVKSLLLDCAHYLDAAYMACRAIARAYPEHAAAVAHEIKYSSAR